jgi:hypothetical protein
MTQCEPASDVAPQPIYAAGGIVTGRQPGTIAVVHRRRYAGEIGTS